MSEEDRIMADAVHWHLASAGDDMDWDGFTVWLEADPRHRAAYDDVSLADDLVARFGGSAARPSAVPVAANGRHLRRWFGAAIAAALVAAAGIGLHQRAPEAVYATGDAARDIALADGSHVALAPHSRLEVAADGEGMTLDGGAWFDIRHRPERSLTIAAGPLKIRDIGTMFDVQANPGTVRIAVAQGHVSVHGPALSNDVGLAQGRGMQFDAAAGTAIVNAIDSTAAGGWRQGHLTYDNAALALVTADLARYARLRIAVPKGLSDRRFSGTLATADGEQQVRDLAQLMGLVLVRDGAGYRLAERAR